MRVLLLSLALAFPSFSSQFAFNEQWSTSLELEEFENTDWQHHRWIAPGENDLRSPCPGMNTLANHGFISRDGRNITIPMVIRAVDIVYNTPSGPDLNLALKLALLTTDAPDSFTLDDLKLHVHGTMEHDASLSRSDESIGDSIHFNSTVFATIAEANPDSDVYDTTSVGQAMEERLALAKQANPNLLNTVKERHSQLLEASLFLSVMGDARTGVAPKKFVHVFFYEERLPLVEGWHRPSHPTTSTSLANIMAQLDKASQAKGPWIPSSLITCPWTRLQPEGPEVVWPQKL
ncbi:Cloroperoxidase [Gymnopus androsaceus JB14]|uniref:Cloroperoxidase n=1 Tax=Gymnopus androsaceus JB14 TaxID=1447944 RepID=A0A6A4HHS6_9AGAR|nr:Cloroperoxidase [Gymnopus androsaceus JB14]